MSGVDHLTTAGYEGPELDTEQFQAARLWITHHRPYYASVLYRCPVVLTDRIPTLAVDEHWRLYVNASFAATLSVEELATVLIHEVNHLLRDHAARARTAAVNGADDRRRWNLAADAEINDDLAGDGLSAPDWVLPSSIGCDDDDVAEHYYAALVATGVDAADVLTGDGGDGGRGRPESVGSTGTSGGARGGRRDERSDDGSDDGSDGGSAGRSGAQRSDQRADRRESRPDGAGACGDGSDAATGPKCGPGAGGSTFDGQIDAADAQAPAVPASEASVLRRRVAEEVQRHHASIGSVPGGLVAWARETLNPTVDWRAVLAATVRAGVAEVAGSADYTYRRFSRRSQAVPQVRLPGMIERIPSVAVVVDTSGSMSDDQIARAFGEVQSILRSCGVMDQSVSVLTVDVNVTVYRRLSDVRRITQIGRGGTDMSAGIAAAAELRPSPDLIVVLTDGYTPWPVRSPRARVIIGLVGQHAGESAVPAYATAVSIPLSF